MAGTVLVNFVFGKNGSEQAWLHTTWVMSCVPGNKHMNCSLGWEFLVTLPLEALNTVALCMHCNMRSIKANETRTQEYLYTVYIYPLTKLNQESKDLTQKIYHNSFLGGQRIKENIATLFNIFFSILLCRFDD